VGEIAYSKQEGAFDQVLVNDDLEQTYLRLVQILQNWFPETDLYLG
jgi:guanylate kinase